MRKAFTLALLCAAITIQAQTTQTLYIHLTNGTIQKVPLEEIEFMNVIFDEQETPDEPVETAQLKINIPSTDAFSESAVLDVMWHGKKMGEVCREYINGIDRPMTLLYLPDSLGNMNISKGYYLSETGCAYWNTEANQAESVLNDCELGDAVYLYNGRVDYSPFDATTEEATLVPQMLVDKRGTETISYPIVKIGCQYWMAENLRAEHFANGTAIPNFSATDLAGWNANTTGASHVYGDSQDFLNIFGRFYNGYAVLSDNGLAPEGWKIPSTDDWKYMRKCAGPEAAYYKTDEPLIWTEGCEGNNMTGFNGIAAGYFLPSADVGDQGEGQDAFFWSSTVVYDPLTRANALETFRLNNAAKNSVVSNGNGHDYKYGHSVRCVKK